MIAFYAKCNLEDCSGLVNFFMSIKEAEMREAFFCCYRGAGGGEGGQNIDYCYTDKKRN